MKKLFGISLVIFWTGTVAILAAGLVINETQNKQSGLASNGQIIDSTISVKPEVAKTATSTNETEILIPGEIQTGKDGVSYQVVEKNVEKTQYLSAEIVSKHNTKNDCWIIVDNTAYSVNEYIPFHPGGEMEIISTCGTDATLAFNTKGGQGKSHSSSATALLKKYFVGKIGDSWGTVLVKETVKVPTATAAVEPGLSTSGGFKIGSAIFLTSDLKVRTTPKVAGSLIGVKSLGTSGKIVEGPILADGFSWYKINYSDGTIGWSVADYLKLAETVVSTPAPSSPVTTPVTPTKPVTVPTTPVTTPVTPTTPPAQNTNELSAVNVAKHNKSSDCWLIISGKVYDVSQYVPFHPGGENQIIQYCGKEATTAFNNRGNTGTHSTGANNLLANYLVGPLVGATSPVVSPTASTCSSFTYSAWGTCQADSTQSRTVNSSSPSSCTGGSPVTSQSCTYSSADTTGPNVVIVSHSNGALISGTVSLQVTATDASGVANVKFLIDSQTISTDTTSPYSASLNTNNYSNGAHTVSAVATDLNGNTSTASVNLSISNVAVTPPASSGLTAADVATHNTSGDCWMIISGKVYDVTQYIPFHPGGQSRIINNCGTDSTTLFTTNVGQGHNHSSSAKSLLVSYLKGNLQTAASTCSSFTYSAWGTCQADSTQSRTVNSSLPSGCTGGSPITSQSCTYVAPDPNASTCSSFTYSAWGTCQADSTQSRTVNSSSPSSCTGGSPVTSQSCTYTPAPANPTTHTINVSSSGGLSPSTLSIAVGDSINFVGVGLGDEVIINFNPSSISQIKIDHERTSAKRTFSTAGTWTFGNGGSVVVQ